MSDADWARAGRADAGYTLGQFHPELNPQGVLPKVTFNVPNSPNFTFDNRLAEKGVAWLLSFRDDLTWIRGAHAFKAGMYFERLRNSEGRGGVGAGPWAGQFNFTVDTANPFDTGHSFANALLGVVPRLHRDRRLPRGAGPRARCSSGTSRTPGG